MHFFFILCIASKACHPRRTARTAGFCASLVLSFFYQYGRPTYERRNVHDGEIHQMSLVSYICQSLKHLHSTFNILKIGFTSNSKLLKSENSSNLKSQLSRKSKTSYSPQSYLTPIQVYKFKKNHVISLESVILRHGGQREIYQTKNTKRHHNFQKCIYIYQKKRINIRYTREVMSVINAVKNF